MYQPLISVTLKNENIFLENIFLAHYILGELTDQPFCFDQGFGKVIGFFLYLRLKSQYVSLNRPELTQWSIML